MEGISAQQWAHAGLPGDGCGAAAEALIASTAELKQLSEQLRDAQQQGQQHVQYFGMQGLATVRFALLASSCSLRKYLLHAAWQTDMCILLRKCMHPAWLHRPNRLHAHSAGVSAEDIVRGGLPQQCWSMQAQELFGILADFARQFDDAMAHMKKQQERQKQAPAHPAGNATAPPPRLAPPAGPASTHSGAPAKQAARLQDAEAQATCSSVASNQNAPANSCAAAEPAWKREAARRQRSLAAVCQSHARTAHAAPAADTCGHKHSAPDRSTRAPPAPDGKTSAAARTASEKQRTCSTAPASGRVTPHAGGAHAFHVTELARASDATPSVAQYEPAVTPETTASKLQSFAPQLSESDSGSDADSNDLVERGSVTQATSEEISRAVGGSVQRAAAGSKLPRGALSTRSARQTCP